jgi:hypothetical protein
MGFSLPAEALGSALGAVAAVPLLACVVCFGPGVGEVNRPFYRLRLSRQSLATHPHPETDGYSFFRTPLLGGVGGGYFVNRPTPQPPFRERLT